MFLPGSRCGSTENENFRCDFMQVPMGKFASTDLSSESPMAYRLLSSFEIKLDDAATASDQPYENGGINMLLFRLLQAQEKHNDLGDAVWEVACNWTEANKE